MAGEEDVELRDLVAQSLEAKGVLGKIRAQLRASVFLALEEQETQQGNHPLANAKLQKFLRTKEGKLATGLVREFLEFFELEFTCAVFDPETNALESYPGREQLAKDVGLDPRIVTSNTPLLSSVLHQISAQTQPPLSQPLHFSEPPRPPPTSGPPVTSSTQAPPPATVSTEDPPRTTTVSVTTTAGDALPLTTLAASTPVTSTASVKLPQDQPPSASSDSTTRARALGSALNNNENGNLRTSDRPVAGKYLFEGVGGGKAGDSGRRPPFKREDESIPEARAELGGTFVNSTADRDKILQQTRGGEESSRDELDDFFDSTHPPPSSDLLSKRTGKDSRSRQEEGGKLPASFASLRDAPSLPGTSKLGALSLPPVGGQGPLELGFDRSMEQLLGMDGEYEDDFHSDGGSGSVSDHVEDPSHPLSSGKLDTTDLSLSGSSLQGAGGGDYDHIEPVQTHP